MRVRTLVLVLLTVGCGASQRPAEPPDRFELRAPSSYPNDFSIDQEVTAIHREGSDSFRAVLEKHGDELVMVGLGPHGGRGFVLRQRGTQVDFESHIPRELPFPPRMMLDDVHRTWLVQGGATENGQVDHTFGVEQYIDTWSESRLVRRVVSSAEFASPIVITYEGGWTFDPNLAAPSRVRIENGFYGYELVLENLVIRAI
jgi:Protein of unknown function (DUF3261)